MKHFSDRLRLSAVLLLFLALLLHPSAALEGARRGLRVCGESVVPSLLPFLTLSGLLNGLGLAEALAGRLSRWTVRLFAAPGCAAGPFLLGLTGGYPVGAAALAALVREGALDPEEAGRLLPVCNNTGPAFLVGAAGLGVFGSGRIGALLYLSHVLSAIGTGLLLSIGKPRTAPSSAPAPIPSRSLGVLLPEAVKSAVRAALNITGFVVFFSVLTALLEQTGLLTAWAGALSLRLGLELRAARALFIGLLELGGGVAALGGVSPTPVNLAICSFVLGFGSLSVHGQTLAVLEGTGIKKTSRLVAGRLLHAALSAAITYLFTLLL